MPRSCRLVPGLSTALATAALLGCTQSGPAIPAAPTRSSASSTTQPTKPNYPINIQRVGMSSDDRGQRLSIQEDGTVLATGRTEGQQVTCSLSADAFTRLSAAALEIARTSTGPAGPPTDALLVEGVSAEDERVAPVRALVTDLLADVARPPAARTLCR